MESQEWIQLEPSTALNGNRNKFCFSSGTAVSIRGKKRGSTLRNLWFKKPQMKGKVNPLPDRNKIMVVLDEFIQRHIQEA